MRLWKLSVGDANIPSTTFANSIFAFSFHSGVSFLVRPPDKRDGGHGVLIVTHESGNKLDIRTLLPVLINGRARRAVNVGQIEGVLDKIGLTPLAARLPRHILTPALTAVGGEGVSFGAILGRKNGVAILSQLPYVGHRAYPPPHSQSSKTSCTAFDERSVPPEYLVNSNAV